MLGSCLTFIRRLVSNHIDTFVTSMGPSVERIRVVREFSLMDGSEHTLDQLDKAGEELRRTMSVRVNSLRQSRHINQSTM
jgi:hypothetical protein